MPAAKTFRHAGFVLIITLALLALVQITARAQSGGEDPQEELGRRLYVENCAVCHGQDGQGRVGATLAKNWPSIRPDLTVRTIIENGVEGSPMPAWSQAKGGPLSEEEIDALVSYILSWQTGGRPEITEGPPPTRRAPITPPPDLGGDPNNGAVLFDENCAVCHGQNGEGRIGATLAKHWAGIRPDLAVKTTIENGVEGSPMPAWSQANGGPLSEDEINDLVAFILSWQGTASSGAAPTATPEPPLSWLSGWGGVIVFVVLLAIIIGVALFFQRRK